MTLDNQTQALIAVGVSVAANCRPCPDYHIGAALLCGVNSKRIAEAIDLGRQVRRGTASNMGRFASSLGNAARSSLNILEGACECVPVSMANGFKKKTGKQ